MLKFSKSYVVDRHRTSKKGTTPSELRKRYEEEQEKLRQKRERVKKKEKEKQRTRRRSSPTELKEVYEQLRSFEVWKEGSRYRDDTVAVKEELTWDQFKEIVALAIMERVADRFCLFISVPTMTACVFDKGSGRNVCKIIGKNTNGGMRRFLKAVGDMRRYYYGARVITIKERNDPRMYQLI